MPLPSGVGLGVGEAAVWLMLERGVEATVGLGV